MESDIGARERRLVRKLDLRMIPYLSLIFMFSFLDRVNIGHARLYGLERALKLTPEQYSWTLSIFFVGYVICEVPSNLMMKRTSPPVWISRIMVTWGVVSVCMAFVKDFAGLLATRFFLGVFEAGLFPGIIFYLSFWYTRKEQAIRIALFFSASLVAGAFGGLIGYAISSIDGSLGLSAWQWVFVLEGAPTILLGIVTWWLLPSTPAEADWLSYEERELLSTRLTRDHVILDGKTIDRKQLRATLVDYKTYLYMLCFFGCCSPLYAMALLMPTIVNALGFSAVNSMLLVIPPYTLAFVVSILVAYNSDRVLDRGIHTMACSAFAIICYSVIMLSKSTIVKYLSMTLGVPAIAACFPTTLSWSNNNLIGSTRSAAASALIIMSGNIGGILTSQLYRPSDGPHFIMSHGICIGFLFITLISATLLRILLKRENIKLNRIQEAGVAPQDLDQSKEIMKPSFQYIL